MSITELKGISSGGGQNLPFAVFRGVKAVFSYLDLHVQDSVGGQNHAELFI